MFVYDIKILMFRLQQKLYSDLNLEKQKEFDAVSVFSHQFSIISIITVSVKDIEELSAFWLTKTQQHNFVLQL